VCLSLIIIATIWKEDNCQCEENLLRIETLISWTKAIYVNFLCYSCSPFLELVSLGGLYETEWWTMLVLARTGIEDKPLILCFVYSLVTSSRLYGYKCNKKNKRKKWTEIWFLVRLYN